MSVARKCDRCKCFFEGSTIENPDVVITVEKNISEYGADRNTNPFCAYTVTNIFNLCPPCNEEFKKFMLMQKGFGG